MADWASTNSYLSSATPATASGKRLGLVEAEGLRTKVDPHIGSHRLEAGQELGRFGTWEWIIATDQVKWASGLEQIHGRETGSFQGTLDDALSNIHPDDRKRVESTLLGAVKTRSDYHAEYRVLTSWAEERWVEATGAVLVDATGQPTHMSGLCTDITARKHSEQFIADSEERFRILANNAPAAIFVKDLEGRYTLANPMACQVLGHSEGVVGLTDFDLLPSAEAEQLRVHDLEAIAAGRAIEREEHFGGNGCARDFLTVKYPMRDARGRVEGVCGIAVDITARKQAAQAQTLLAAIVESSNDAIIGKDIHSKILTWNAGAERIFGYSAKEAIGQSVRMLIPENCETEEDEIINRLRHGERISNFQTVRRTKDGGDVHVSLTVSPLRDDQGRIIGASKIVRDITDQRRTEAELAAAKDDLAMQVASLTRLHELAMVLTGTKDLSQSLHAVLEAAREIHDADGGFISLLDEAGDFLSFIAGVGLDAASLEKIARLSARSPATVCGTSFSNKGRVIVEEIENEYSYEADREIARAGGFRTVHSTPILTLSGMNLGVLTLYHKRSLRQPLRQAQLADVCARYAAEIIEASKSQIALRESETRFRNIADYAPALIWVNNIGGCEFVNLEYLRFVGLDQENLQKDGWQQFLHPDDSPGYLAAYRDAFDRRAPFEAVCRLRRADGEYRWLRSVGMPRFDRDGGFLGYVGCSLDITEIKRSEEELKEAKESAEEANRSKDRFLAVLSHELRTPLSPVLLTVAAMKDDPKISAALREEVAMIHRNVLLETKLIDDLLDLSRITTGKLRLQVEPIDLNTAVEQVCEICRPQIEEKKLRLHVELDPQGGAVFGDSARLQQVLWNVLKNAVKFTPEGGDVYVRTVNDLRGPLRIILRDTGIGIAPENIAHIFNAFEQGSSKITRQFGGLGLGLAISKAIIELHRGSIRVQSDGTSKGATFTIELPAHAPPVQQAPSNVKETEEIVAPLRLLVVEDHGDTAKVMGRLLKLSGYEVLTARTAAEAMALASGQPFDVLISDIGLPDYTGYDLMIRMRRRYPIKGIAMSGYGMEEDLRRSREAGFSEHLVKPVGITQLKQAICRVANIS
jgi:PAS domain S-box-containing protein